VTILLRKTSLFNIEKHFITIKLAMSRLENVLALKLRTLSALKDKL